MTNIDPTWQHAIDHLLYVPSGRAVVLPETGLSQTYSQGKLSHVNHVPLYRLRLSANGNLFRRQSLLETPS
jgi:hypothetical protein